LEPEEASSAASSIPLPTVALSGRFRIGGGISALGDLRRRDRPHLPDSLAPATSSSPPTPRTTLTSAGTRLGLLGFFGFRRGEAAGKLVDLGGKLPNRRFELGHMLGVGRLLEHRLVAAKLGFLLGLARGLDRSGRFLGGGSACQEQGNRQSEPNPTDHPPLDSADRSVGRGSNLLGQQFPGGSNSEKPPT